MNEYDHPLDI